MTIFQLLKANFPKEKSILIICPKALTCLGQDWASSLLLCSVRKVLTSKPYLCGASLWGIANHFRRTLGAILSGLCLVNL